MSRWSCNPVLRGEIKTEDLFDVKKQTFLGYRISQTWTALFMLEYVLVSNRDLMRIVELGTGCGGSALFFGLHMAPRAGRVLTFDVRKRPKPSWYNWLKRLPITFKQRNVFQPETVEEVKSFIKNHRALIFCDNGDKKREFPLYAPILKKNDLIMVHDWKVEVDSKHLNRKILSFLKPYRQKEFNNLETQILSMVRK